MSQIIALQADIQKKFYDYIISIGAKTKGCSINSLRLWQIRLLFLLNVFIVQTEGIEDRCETIIQTIRDIMDHQSNESTDIRFVALYFNLLSGKVHLLKEQVELLTAYPTANHSDEIMRMARPTVRFSTEMMY